MSDTMDEAIETAAYSINKKESKKHKKHCSLFKGGVKKGPGNELTVGCSCGGLRVELEEGKDSPVMKSPRVNRKSIRREGVAEKNETERKLVKETIKVILKGSNIEEYNF